MEGEQCGTPSSFANKKKEIEKPVNIEKMEISKRKDSDIAKETYSKFQEDASDLQGEIDFSIGKKKRENKVSFLFDETTPVVSKCNFTSDLLTDLKSFKCETPNNCANTKEENERPINIEKMDISKHKDTSIAKETDSKFQEDASDMQVEMDFSFGKKKKKKKVSFLFDDTAPVVSKCNFTSDLLTDLKSFKCETPNNCANIKEENEKSINIEKMDISKHKDFGIAEETDSKLREGTSDLQEEINFSFGKKKKKKKVSFLFDDTAPVVSKCNFTSDLLTDLKSFRCEAPNNCANKKKENETPVNIEMMYISKHKDSDTAEETKLQEDISDLQDEIDLSFGKKKRKKKVSFFFEDTVPVVSKYSFTSDLLTDLKSFKCEASDNCVNKKKVDEKSVNIERMNISKHKDTSIAKKPDSKFEEDASDMDDEVDLSFKKKKSKKKVSFILEDTTPVISKCNFTSDLLKNLSLSEKCTSDNIGDYSYEYLLTRAFDLMRKKNPNLDDNFKKKLIMKPPQVLRIGIKKTSLVNFLEICKILRRTPQHIQSFLLVELGTNGSIDSNGQLIIKGKFQQKQLEHVLRRYIKEYVTCHTCHSPDTILLKETRLCFLQCEVCCSRCSVGNIKSGFQAVISKRAAIRAKVN